MKAFISGYYQITENRVEKFLFYFMYKYILFFQWVLFSCGLRFSPHPLSRGLLFLSKVKATARNDRSL